MSSVNIFGTDWCEDTRHAKHHLQSLRIPYDYVDIEANSAARDWVKRQNDGQQKTPTVDVEGLVLSVPSDGELDTALRARGFLS